METSAHPVSPCTPQTVESNKLIELPIFKIENITIARSPLLKIFYWESFNIENLNKELLTPTKYIEHHLELPTHQLNSKPLKIIFWLRNLSNFEYSIRSKRMQNCQCVPRETRVGFNQFRNMYHCPHRRLIDISSEMFIMKPNELLALPMVSYYYILGTYILSYELRISDSRIVILHFHVNITAFDAVKSVLTTHMIPVHIKEHRYMSQPLWIRNITIQNLQLFCTSKNRGIRFINPIIVIPPQSVWPLIVEYRPNDFENNLELFLIVGGRTAAKCNTNNRYKIPITCKGFIEKEIENYPVPILDYACSDHLYIIYPNRLEFIMEINEERTLMVAVHNYNENCMEFKWQKYALNKRFTITFEPAKFSLKPHHSKLCVVRVKSFNNALHFKRIPGILEIHRILDKDTQIAQELLKEIESIDDPKWLETSYVEHIYLHLDVKVKFPQIQRINVNRQFHDTNGNLIEMETSPKIENNCTTTIFDKLFWEYLGKSNYMRNTSKIPRNLTYKQVVNQKPTTKKIQNSAPMEKEEAFNILSFLTAEACRDLCKNYRFVPPEVLDSN